MDYDGLNLAKVQQRRREIIKKAFDNGKFDTEAYANYFEVKRKLIEEDLMNIYNIKRKETDYHNYEVKVENLHSNRKRNIEKLREKGFSEIEILEKIGMWHEPIKDIKRPEEILVKICEVNNPPKEMSELAIAAFTYKISKDKNSKEELIKAANDYIAGMDKALMMIQYGSNRTDIKSVLKWDTQKYNRMCRLLSVLSVESTPDYQLLSYTEVRDALQYIRRRYNKFKISEYTGVASNIINEIKKIDDLEKFLDDINDSVKTDGRKRTKERRKWVWEQYIEADNPIMEDLGNSDGIKVFLSKEKKKQNISRITISSDIKEYLRESVNDPIDKIAKEEKGELLKLLDEGFDLRCKNCKELIDAIRQEYRR